MRWNVTSLLPLLPWQWDVVEACGTPDPTLLRKLVARSESVSCVPEWWSVSETEHPEELASWFAAQSVDDDLRAQDRWRAALVTQSLGRQPPPVVWTRAAAARRHDRVARAVLWDARERFGDALDPASAVAADLSRWVAEDLRPEHATDALRWVARGWATEQGIGHVARSMVSQSPSQAVRGPSTASSITRRVYGADDSATLQEACERAESTSCVAAVLDRLDATVGRTGRVSPLMGAWGAVAGVDEQELAALAAAWEDWGKGVAAEDRAAVLLERMQRAVGIAHADPLALDPASPAAPWTSVLATVWLARAMGDEVEVRRLTAGVELTLAGQTRRRGPCGRPLPTLDPPEVGVAITDAELVAHAAWERGRVHDDPVFQSFARRLGGHEPPVGASTGARLASMMRPTDPAVRVEWQSCGP